jgi:phosphoenolpyruvate synthase/pyruvate phosphate dikinase
MPEVYEQFVKIATSLENHYKDMQDMEFTIERRKLLCSRPATESAQLRRL